MSRTPTETTLRMACMADTLSEAFAFVMEHLDAVEPDRIEISVTWGGPDFDTRRYEVVVSGAPASASIIPTGTTETEERP